jgi:hypothetical protein
VWNSGGICKVNTFFNPVACGFPYKAKDLSATSYSMPTDEVENFFREFICNVNAVGQYIYKTIAYHFLFYLVPKQLLYMNNNSSKYKLNPTAALGMLCTSDGIEG